MSFLETVERARAFLERNGRISLRALQREFNLDEDALEEVVEELVDVQQVAAREGKVLAWIGATHAEASALEPDARAASEVSPIPAQAERRQLTVMFCDLVGSTDLSQHLDAEDLRNVIRAYQESASSAIERYEGHIAQYLGDGLLVYFGYPQAHEDDAERAVRAGLGIVGAIAASNAALEKQHGLRLAVRIGIHTGPVVVGEMGAGERKETLAIGGTPNVAARLEGIAEPDTVVISDATLRLLAGLVISEDLGTPALKGSAEPVRVHRVIQMTGVLSRLERAPGLTPFVGREEELALLLARWEQTQEKRGQAVLIAGEAGIGKSRLVHRLRERLRETPHSWLECRSSPYTQGSALYPVIELVEQVLRLGDVDSPEEKVSRLESALELAGFELAEAVPLFTSLLSLRLPERYAPLEISPQLQRQKTLEALLAWGLSLAETQPVVLLVEDLHWVDPSTLEWLGPLIEQCATAGVLLLLTFRPDFEPPWPGRAHVHLITLDRLSRRQAKDLVTAAISGEALSEPVVDQLAARSDGIPLFVEELAKGVVESGRDLTGSISGLEIPETLQDLLMARLDRLGEAKEVAQLGAALGREFPYALLEAVAPLKEVTLREGLVRLVEAELVYQRGLPPKATYTFKHALVQDTAYESLLESQRKELHGRIAKAILERIPDVARQQPELVAHHLSETADPSRAVEYWQRAGDRALARSADCEAGSHFGRGLELLSSLPDGRSRERCELPLQLGLGAVSAQQSGWATDESEHTWRRSLALANTLGDKNARAGALWGLATMHQTRGELRESQRFAVELRDTGREIGDIWVELAGWANIVYAHYLLGEPETALDRLGEMLARDPVSEVDPSWFVYAQSQRVWARAEGAHAAWIGGYAERAISLATEAMAMAKQVPSPLGFCAATAVTDYVLMDVGQIEALRAAAEEMRAIAEEHDLQLWIGMAQVHAAWANAAEGVGGEDPAAASVQAIGRVISESRGVRADAPHTMWLHADVLRRVGRLAEAEEWAANALAFAEATEQPFWNAELHRTLGEIRLSQDEPDEAKAKRRFEKALEIARAQHARSLELRAATSLARLLRDQGRNDEARALLQPVYDWFTEGFDTQDLKDAKALLGTLASS